MARLDRSDADLQGQSDPADRSSFQTRLEVAEACFYERDGDPHEISVVLYHDARGCVPVCSLCAHWREGSAHVSGHAADCIEKEKT